MDRDLLEVLTTEVGAAIMPLERIFSRTDALRSFLIEELGYDIPPSLADIGVDPAVVQPVFDGFDELAKVLSEEQPDDVSVTSAWGVLAVAVARATSGIFSGPPSLSGRVDPTFLSASRFIETVPRRVFDWLIIRRLDAASPVLERLLNVLGITERHHVAAELSTFTRAHERLVVHYERVPQLLTDPDRLFQEIYGWGSTRARLDELLLRVSSLATVVGARTEFVWLSAEGQRQVFSSGPAASSSEEQLLPQLRVPLISDGGAEAGLSLAIIPPSTGAGALGLALMPFASSGLNEDTPLDKSGSWRLNVQGSLDAVLGVGVIARPDEPLRVVLDPGGTGADASGELELNVRRIEPSGEAIPLASFGETIKVTAEALSVGLGLVVGTDVERDIGITLGVHRGEFKLDTTDGDGFLRKVVPGTLEARFEFTLGLSARRGVYFQGSGLLEVTQSLQTTIGPLSLNSVTFKLSPNTEALTLLVGASGTVRLGPVVLGLERFGTEIHASAPPSGGNLGPVALRYGFKPPDGVALSVDAGSVRGGGHMFFDSDAEQYAGSVQLTFSNVSLSATGLITTCMPDGSEGFSLLVIVSGEFPAIQLGFGFTLLGAGGLLGVNRTVVIDVLREGVRTGGLNAVLFPQDPVRNAPQIVSQLSGAFPPATDHYVFGPMAKLAWGTPKLISIELGVALELPSPVRLIVMGRIKVVLPDEETALVEIKVDVLGVVDFDRGEASVDATLYDSRVATFAIGGDMAMRARWSSDPNFALSAGGLHPRYTPPPGFPTLRRLSIALASGNNPRLLLEGYLAVTSNTFQIGAKLSVYAEADLGWIGTFSFDAYLGFDVLIHFSPFSFIAELAAGAALKRNGHDLMSVDLQLTLTGPKPLHGWGQASFKFLGRHSIDVEVTIGDNPPPEELPTADPLPLLMTALASSGNWEAQMPVDEEMLATLSTAPPDTGVLAHPLGRLLVRERVVPLNVDIERFGNATPSGDRRFAVEATIGGVAPSPSPDALKQEFAAAQFFDMSDDEKLSRPSFEPMDGGLHFASPAVQHGASIESKLVYETTVIDQRRRTFVVAERYRLMADRMFAQAVAGAAARSPMRQSGGARYKGERIGIEVRDPDYVAASKEGLDTVAGASPSFTEALQTIDSAARKPNLQVVREYEVVR